MSRNEIIVLVLVIVVICISLARLVHMNAECTNLGGVMVRGTIGHVCLKAERVK